MFFTRFWFYMLGLLPVHGQIPRYLRVALGYYDCRLRLEVWHRAELEKLNPVRASKSVQVVPKRMSEEDKSFFDEVRRKLDSLQ